MSSKPKKNNAPDFSEAAKPSDTRTASAVSPPEISGARPNLLAAAQIRTEINPRVAVKKKVVHVPCRRPSKNAFVRTNPDNHADFWLLEGADEQTYVVHPDVAAELGDLVRPKRLIPTIDREGNLSLWPIKLQDRRFPTASSSTDSQTHSRKGQVSRCTAYRQQ